MIPDILMLFVLLSICGTIIYSDYHLNVKRKAKKAVPNMTNKLRAFDKVKKVIESCETYPQILVAGKMLDCFLTLYGVNVYWTELSTIYEDTRIIIKYQIK